MKRIWIIAALALLLSACVPAANLGKNFIEKPDGSSLLYLTDGLGFDPGESAALGVILIVSFDTLASYTAPEGATCEVEAQFLDCRLGDVSERVVLRLSATNVDANASFRRAGSSDAYLVFVR